MPPKRKASDLLEAAAAAGAASASVCVQDDGESKEGCNFEEGKEEPERKKPYGTCQHPDCFTQASFGFADGKRTRCGLHKCPGMNNLKTRTCQHPDCFTEASLGFADDKRTRCGPHRLPGMDYYKTRKRCETEGCDKEPSFGLERGKATHCFDHKSEEQFDVKNKKCAQPGCQKQPNFGWKEEEALFCKDHREEGMDNVTSKKCLEPDCHTQATYGLKGKKASWCADHATDEMINLLQKLCEEPGCTKTAYFGYTKGQPTHCRNHGDPEMEDVLHKRCQGPGCKKLVPPYGNHLTGRAFCVTCRDIKNHWKLKICTKDKCRNWATHSETGCLPFVFCETHASVGFSSYLESRCKNTECNMPYICDKDGFCDVCTPSKKYEKVSENLMKAFFENKGLTFEHNLASAGSACSNKRPDFLFRTPFGLIAVENDEHQHRNELCECEQARMIGLREAFGEAVHFIRFNPDLYKPIKGQKRTNKVHLGRRHEQLFDVLQNILSNTEAFFERFPRLSVSYMYYDDCDTSANWKPNAIVY